MKQRDDDSGQIMLTGAFILAIILIFIALLLNNVIYFNNVTYIGFMGQSGYNDVSIKKLVAQEAINAYEEFHDDEEAFNRTMLDVADSLNNVTLPEGIKVVISPPYYFYKITNIPATTFPSTRFNLTIYTKDSTKTYFINTSHSPPLPTPTPGPTPLKCKVTVSSPSNNSIVYQGGTNHTFITISVINTSNPSIPVVNQKVNVNNTFSVSSQTLTIGKLCKNEDGTSIIDNYGNPAVTDIYGNIKLYWFPLSLEGTDVINASIGDNPSLAEQNLSNNVTIINKIFNICHHTVNISEAQHNTNHDGNNYYINIQVPLTAPSGSNFSFYRVGAFLNESASSNAIILSYSDMGNFSVSEYVTGPLTAPNEMIKIRLGWPYANGPNKQFKAVLTVTVSAYCNVDNGYYWDTKTFTVTGPP